MKETPEEFRARVGSLALRGAPAGPKVTVDEHSETHRAIVTNWTDAEGDHQGVRIEAPPIRTGIPAMRRPTTSQEDQ